MTQFAFISILIFSVFAIQTHKLRHAVIYLAAFSLSMVFVFLLYSAPDVALAEAIIGSTLSTILYLVALQKYKIFTIYICIDGSEIVDTHYFSGERSLEKKLSKFCAKEELEPQVIYTVEDFHDLLEHPYAIIITFEMDSITFYSHPENLKMDALIAFLNKSKAPPLPYRFIQMEEKI